MELNKETQPEKPVKSAHAEREEKILAFWNDQGIFEKSLKKISPRGDFVFYDGPPFATGLPHYGHILPNTIKDVIPRFKTMQGYHVARRWGWDCHGLPVENLIEKELGLRSKKDILDYGIAAFNKKARDSVLRYAKEWREQIPRFGRWVDMEDDYRTMDPAYTESVWWVFKSLQEKGLVYEGFKSMHLCPRCETTLSNFEVTQGYKDVTDISVYVKFALTEEEQTFVLAWTTTPWTLPGNVALAVHPDIQYVKVRATEPKAPVAAHYILAKEKLPTLFKDISYEIVLEMKGSELIGKSYKPPFSYYSDQANNNAWKIYPAEFVTLEKGTGIVHIAPAFGDDDLALAQKHKLPIVHHVGTDGAFKKEVTDFAGQQVKPKEDPQKADIEVIKNLAHRGLLFSKEKLIHSYPHCWRCETPLLNYASSSWFVKVTDIKDRLVSENKKINWTPDDVKEGRFGNWLANARDWAISRSRFWGAPLPVWRCSGCSKFSFVGSVAELAGRLAPRNTYLVMRHGQAEHNVKKIMSSKLANQHHLTEKGRAQATTAAETLKDKKIDLIFASPFIRTQETVREVCKVIGFDSAKVITDARIGEVNSGKFDGRSVAEYHAFFESDRERFTKRPEGGETYSDIADRVSDFLYETERKYEGKTILIVTHDSPAWLLASVAKGLNNEQALTFRGTTEFFLENAEVRNLVVKPLPRNEKGQLDLHRPYIDEVSFKCVCGEKMKRVPEVFDCWFESGSMPYGEAHHPFEHLNTFSPKSGLFRKAKGYPADFIAEGLDQTRGWFYSMLVLGVALFDKTPYRSVVVNGLILAEDGRKMSKRLNNYPDPMLLVSRYGADAIRYYLLASPVVKAQDLCFSERGVDEVAKKHLGRLDNVRTFYELYADTSVVASDKSAHVLDCWILIRLNEVATEMTDVLERYELDRACRPIALFIDDLSTWYLRRSRDRFKGSDLEDKRSALATTRLVLTEFSKLLAPITPFYAEHLYQSLKKSGSAADVSFESVHLDAWPKWGKTSSPQRRLLDDMSSVRSLVSQGLEARMKAKINVRQPLAKLKVKGLPAAGTPLQSHFEALIKDEVNVKTVEVVPHLPEGLSVELDLTLNQELKDEGVVRELVRAIQDLRKQAGFSPSDQVALIIDTDDLGKAFVEPRRAEIAQVTGLKSIEWGIVQQGTHLDLDRLKFALKVLR